MKSALSPFVGPPLIGFSLHRAHVGHVDDGVAVDVAAQDREPLTVEPAPGLALRLTIKSRRLRIVCVANLLMETEVAFTLGRRIDQPVDNVDALKPRVKWVHAAFDVG